MQVQGLHLPTNWASSDLFFHSWNTTTGVLDFLHQPCFHSQCFNLLKTINPILHTESSVPINLFKTSFILSYTNSKLAWDQFSYSSKAGSELFLNKTCMYTGHLPLKYVSSFSKYVLDGSYMLDTALGLGDSEMSRQKPCLDSFSILMNEIHRQKRPRKRKHLHQATSVGRKHWKYKSR